MDKKTDKEKAIFDLKAFFKAEKTGKTVRTFKPPYGSILSEDSVATYSVNGDWVAEYNYTNGQMSVYPL